MSFIKKMVKGAKNALGELGDSVDKGNARDRFHYLNVFRSNLFKLTNLYGHIVL